MWYTGIPVKSHAVTINTQAEMPVHMMAELDYPISAGFTLSCDEVVDMESSSHF